MSDTPFDPGVSRRDLLKTGAGAVALAVSGVQLATPVQAQTPKKGGTLRLTFQADPLHFDPHQTLSFVTMCPLSLCYSRLVKVKAGPTVKPMTYPVEADLAESWTQPNDTTYIFKLKKGVRWHNKPPVNGREFTADDVKFTYERFLTITGNPNKPVLEYVDKIEAVDKYTVKFTLKEPNAWFIDLLASTSTWIIAKECVEKFGDLKKVESVVGTGPWMLDRWEPNVKIVFSRHPNYHVPGLPYADNVEWLIDKDPASRLATWLSGKSDFGPEYQHAVRWLDAPVARQRKPGLQTTEYTWFTAAPPASRSPTPRSTTSGSGGRSRAPATSPRSTSLSPSRRGTGRRTPRCRRPSPSGRSRSTSSIPRAASSTSSAPREAKKLLAEAGHPNGFKTTVEAPSVVYGPDFDDFRGDHHQELEGGWYRRRPQAQGVRGVHLQHHLRKVRRHVPRPAGRVGGPRGVLLPLVSCRGSRSTRGA